MKALLVKKIERIPYNMGEDLNGKIIAETTTIYLIGMPIFKKIIKLLS